MEVNQVYSVHFQRGEDKTQPKPLDPTWKLPEDPLSWVTEPRGPGSGAVLGELTHIIGKGALESIEDKPALLP